MILPDAPSWVRPPPSRRRCCLLAQNPTIKIGVLNDQSGPYRDDGGPTGVACAKQALEDFGISGKGWNVEVISADHQNKPDVGVSSLGNGSTVTASMRSSMCRHPRSAWRSTRCAGRRTRSSSILAPASV